MRPTPRSIVFYWVKYLRLYAKDSGFNKLVRMSVYKYGCRWIESHQELAQWLDRQLTNLEVVGSNSAGC